MPEPWAQMWFMRSAARAYTPSSATVSVADRRPFAVLSVAEQRYQAVLAVIEDGVAVTAVAEEYQVTGAGSGR